MTRQTKTSELPATRPAWGDIEPFRDFFDQPFRLSRFFDRPFGAPAGSGGWVPALDFKETKDGYEVTVELPGTKKEDISIECQDNVLTVRGQKSSEREEREGDHIHYTERTFGSFSRSVRLPPDSTGDAKATFKDGVLKIDIPKAEERKPRRVQIDS